MMNRSGSMLALVAGAAAAVLLAGTAGAQDKTLIIGVQCDRTGATQIVGTVLCPAMHDYFNLINSISNLRLILFGVLIIFFLVVEPEGLNRLWRNIRNYFRVWPFSY